MFFEGGAVPDFIAQKLGSVRLVTLGGTDPDDIMIPSITKWLPDHIVLHKTLIVYRTLSVFVFKFFLMRFSMIFFEKNPANSIRIHKIPKKSKIIKIKYIKLLYYQISRVMLCGGGYGPQK